MGNIISDKEAIIDRISFFYHQLYTTDHTSSATTIPFLKATSNIISSDLRETLNVPLRDMEITKTLKGFKPLKSPGSDGLHPLFF